MSRTIKVDFYQVDTPNPGEFPHLINIVSNLRVEDRNYSYANEAPVRMQSVFVDTNIIEGDMIRIRMDEVPLKASLQGRTEFIRLNDDEGIGEDTAFLYCKNSNVLLLQRNRYAVSSSAFAYYFKNMCNVNYVFLNPILRTDIMLKLGSMSIFRKFSVKIAGIQNSEIFRGQIGGIASIINCKDQYEAPNISLTVSMGRSRGSLSLENIMESIRTILNISDNYDKTVKRLDVVAQEDYTSNPEYLDILKARVIEQVDVNLDTNRHLSYNIRRQALRDAWNRRCAELEARFSTR